MITKTISKPLRYPQYVIMLTPYTHVMSKQSGVYKIVCKANGKVYVGSSDNVNKRWGTHQRLLALSQHPNIHLQHAWDLHGKVRFEFELVEACPVDTLREREQYWIEQLHACDARFGLNISLDATAPMTGRKHSKETLVHLAEVHVGLKHTEESKAKISAALRGKKKSPEHVEKLRQLFMGRKASAETRRKLSEIHKNPSPELRRKRSDALRGKKRNPEYVERSARTRSQHFLITDPEQHTYDVWGLARFCREHGLDQGSMSKVAMGQAKAHKGWRCQRLENVNG